LSLIPSPLVLGVRPVVPPPCEWDDLCVARTVIIVDDHAPSRNAARRLLELDGFEVVGEAEDGASALALVRRLKPDLVLLDVMLPDRNGFEIAAELAESGSKIVLISSRGKADFGPRARESGALGFIAKEQLSRAAISELLEGAA
jgi:DNA-binding NarL/FixJ family response regulator